MKDYIEFMNISEKTPNKDIFVSFWLFILTIMTFLIIIIGGLTRLTESGLSMVNWRPIMGFLPPLSYEDWLKVFNDYKNSPEFLIVNKTMNLQEFKYIFWWEWFHRFFARCIGIVFIIPLFIFFFQKKISKKLLSNLFILFLFGLFQGLVGWWMVKSGLSENPYVSPYRLAFHLTNAIIILSILFWLSLNSLSLRNINFIPSNKFQLFIIILVLLLFITIISGAFMAGADAGKSFNSYPLMNNELFPQDYLLEDLGIRNLFENTVAINFNHRWLATLTFIIIVFFTINIFINRKYSKHLYKIALIFILTCIQFILGIITLLTNVEITFASMHQINSVLLLLSFLFFYNHIKKEI